MSSKTILPQKINQQPPNLKSNPFRCLHQKLLPNRNQHLESQKNPNQRVLSSKSVSARKIRQKMDMLNCQSMDPQIHLILLSFTSELATPFYKAIVESPSKSYWVGRPSVLK